MPGGMIALARTNVPGIYVYGGTIKPGHWKGKDLTIVSSFEAVGEFAAGRMSQEDFDGIERNACPTTGSCGGMYTANTMSASFEALGMALLGSSTMANPDAEKVDSAAESARVLVHAIELDLKPRDIITRKSIENAVAVIMAIGGSTNAVLHYLAIAHAAEVEWTLDDFERVQAASQSAIPQVIFPVDQALYAQGHLAILKGNLAPNGAVAKITGLKNPVMTGPARVFDDEHSALSAILEDRIRPGDGHKAAQVCPKCSHLLQRLLAKT
ncbi:Dihydroxy-acid dehydratase 1 [Podila epicladia]|nr:Dihydroxy-acid dehydratase 1 [Podila epicladia]